MLTDSQLNLPHEVETNVNDNQKNDQQKHAEAVKSLRRQSMCLIPRVRLYTAGIIGERNFVAGWSERVMGGVSGDKEKDGLACVN